VNPIDEIAIRAGVSTATVSRTFRAPEKLRKETATRILQIADQLNYSPTPRRSRRKSNNHAGPTAAGNIGFLFFCEHPREIYSRDAFYGLILHGAQTQAKALGLTVEADIAERYTAPRVLPAMVAKRSVGGLLLVGAAPTHVLGFFSSAAPHIVYVDHLDPSGERDGVLSDGIGGAMAIMSYLGSLGHRRIAFVCPVSEAVTFRERYQGYQLYCIENDIPLDPHQIVMAIGYDDARARVEELITSKNAPTAIFAANDLTASWVLHACHARSINVPTQLSVAGFDDVDLARHIWPPLTTLHVDIEGIGQQAVLRLYEKMTLPSSNSAGLTPVEIRVQGSVVIRQSTCPPPKPS